MKIRTRIMLGYLLVAVAGFAATWQWVEDDVVPHYSQSMEESLVEISQLLAVWLSNECSEGRIDTTRLSAAFEGVGSRKFEAQIYSYAKNSIHLRVYVTDAAGKVLFDSNRGEWVGQDFSQWRDVYRTLKGQYGARATRVAPNDALSSVLYVGAPVYCQGKLAGVLTASKPVNGLLPFIEKSKQQIVTTALAVSLLTAGIGLLMAAWLTRPIDRLTRYVNAVKEGRRVPLPDPGNSELGGLALALEELRDELEGRQYAEHYVQSLTHGLKSPLAGIRAAAELLEEDMAPAQRAKFLNDIHVEVGRLDRTVDRLLMLATVEQRKRLDTAARFDLARTLRLLCESFASSAQKAGVMIQYESGTEQFMEGDEFLCEQAVANLIQNAVEFSPSGGVVSIRLESADGKLIVTVEDSGPGVPDYALDRVFERFFSLPRPATGKKSSGLGLSFVKEVAQLHGGTVRLEPRAEMGTRAVLELSIKPPVV